MVRPRGAGFCYGEEDFEVMLEDARILLCKGWLQDMTTCGENVSFAYREEEKGECKKDQRGDYEIVDTSIVKKFIDMAMTI